MPMAVDIIQVKENDDNKSDLPDKEQPLSVKLGELETEKESAPHQITQYEKLCKDLSEDERCLKEFAIGKRIGFYRLRNEIGSGNFAKVKLGFHCLAREKVAIKILDKTKLDEKTKRLLSQEICSMEKLAHPVVIRIFEVLETLSKVYIVTEYATSGELFHKIMADGKFSEKTAKKYFAQLLSAVTYMHDSNIIHRDIKAENVFLSSSGVKLGDFGFSTIISSSEQHLNTFCGSPPYAAPELFKDDFYLGKYVDIWALGILLFFMSTGSMPFHADTVGKLKRKILEGTFTVPDFVSSSLRFLIRRILRLVPTDRFTLPEIMRSNWLEGAYYPKPSKFNRLKPPLSNEDMDEIEVAAIKQLHVFGITADMMKECPDNTRNNINGTFRIALFQGEKRAVENQLDKEAKVLQDIENLKIERSKKSSKNDTTRSKFCTVI